MQYKRNIRDDSVFVESDFLPLQIRFTLITIDFSLQDLTSGHAWKETARKKPN